MDKRIWNHRQPLFRLRRAIASGVLRLGFIGGSITDARARHNWPEPVIAWFVERYPNVRVFVENAAIGATGSELGVFRAERDLIERDCDIVFVEFAVNDSGEPVERRKRTREGLLRKLLADGKRDVVLVHTYMQAFYAEMIAGEVPDSIEELERLGDHYGLGSVWMGLHALEEVKLGRMRWEEWLPDGLHPTERGSLSYAQSVNAFLEKELSDGRFAEAGEDGGIGGADGRRLPEPLNAAHWEKAHMLPWSDVEIQGPWTIRRWPHLEWIDQALSTAAVGARLAFSFTGRGLTLGFDFGKSSSEFLYRIDGGEWTASQRERPAWCANEGWFRVFPVADDLEPGTHTFELEVVHGNTPECTGTNCCIAFAGIIP